MTPLAQDIVSKQIALNKVFVPELGSSDCRCFEVSKVLDIVLELVTNRSWNSSEDIHVFLPAPITWIEYQYRTKNDNRKIIWGMLIKTEVDGFDCRSIVNDGDQVSEVDSFSILKDTENEGKFSFFHPEDSDDSQVNSNEVRGSLLLGFLALINTPKLFHKKQHQPDISFQRTVSSLKHQKRCSAYKLYPWTEITLDINPPESSDGSSSRERLTAGKALHFCRSHLRIRLGKLELVSAHWRGDPALGIRRSKYAIRSSSGTDVPTDHQLTQAM